MKSNKGLYIGLFILLAGTFVFFGLRSESVGHPVQDNSAKPAGAQPAGAQSEALIRLSSPAKPASEAVSKSPAFDTAALENIRMQNDLAWVFGGKSQRGWRLYTPLISRILDVDEEAQTASFAFALSRWQKERGLDAHGVLDNSTWFQMISAWQSDRIKDRTYPTADQLVMIPVSECYDPSRADELRKVERETYLAYKRMIQAAAADPSLGLALTADGELASGEKYLKIISAYRSREYQEHLRKQSPNSGRAGLAVNSPHFTGRALDIYVGGEPVSTKDDNRALQTRTPVYRWLVKNAARFGFRPYFYEPWHWEYVGQK
jgi:D-alanyl-D-alanine carboxypeptidase